MPFVLFNALMSFQSYINKVLVEKLDIFINVYLDDNFIYTKKAEESHKTAVQWILELLQKNRLYFNLKKY